MQIITITGRVGGNAETRDAGSSKVTNFSVAVDQGYGEGKTTNWYRVGLWGERGVKLREYIRKGDKVAVTGELTIGEYQGKPQYDVRCHDVDCFMAPKGDRVPDGSQGSSAPREPVDELEDDVPFVSANAALERRVG
jgi:single-strand DNA-binding protein